MGSGHESGEKIKKKTLHIKIRSTLKCIEMIDFLSGMPKQLFALGILMEDTSLHTLLISLF